MDITRRFWLDFFIQFFRNSLAEGTARYPSAAHSACHEANSMRGMMCSTHHHETAAVPLGGQLKSDNQSINQSIKSRATTNITLDLLYKRALFLQWPPLPRVRHRVNIELQARFPASQPIPQVLLFNWLGIVPRTAVAQLQTRQMPHAAVAQRSADEAECCHTIP